MLQGDDRMGTSVDTATSNDPRAHELLKAAHNRGWRFPESFAGLSADITVQAAGQNAIQGTLNITGPRESTLELDAPDDLKQWVSQQLASMIGHRWARAYEDGDGKYEMVLEEDGDPRGPLLRQLNDPFGSSYRVLDEAISVVNRTMGITSFTISMQEHVEATDGRSLPRAFTVSYRNTETGQLERVEIFQDTYGVIEGVDVPIARRVSLSDGDGVNARSFTLSNIQLHG